MNQIAAKHTSRQISNCFDIKVETFKKRERIQKNQSRNLARVWPPPIAAPSASTASAPTIRTTSRARRAAAAAAAPKWESLDEGEGGWWETRQTRINRNESTQAAFINHGVLTNTRQSSTCVALAKRKFKMQLILEPKFGFALWWTTHK